MKRFSLAAGVACALATFAVSGQAQTKKLTTLFAANNGGSAGGAVYFDIKITKAVRITQFETNFSATATTAVGFKVYTAPTTSVGKETTKSLWKLVGQDDGKAKAAGRNAKTLINLKAPIILTPGSYGMAIEAIGSGHAYTNGTTTNNKYSNTDMSLVLGKASNVAFTGGLFSPRVWNGSFIYTNATGLYSDFTGTPVSGKSPLSVQFTDTTYTSNTRVVSWAWDFNGDTVIDSRVQNPKFVFAATGFDKTFDVTLTTIDNKALKSTVTKKAFITVNPSNATAVDFGAGSTNKPINAAVKMSKYSYTYAYLYTRGYYFQAPTLMVINGFRVPNEKKLAQQSVLCYTTTAALPAYPSTYSVKAADVKFFAEKQKAGVILKPTSPIVIKKGTWVGILGACHAANSTTMNNSYGNGPVKTTILGKATTLYRSGVQGGILGTKGLVSAWGSTTGSIGRVEMYVVGNTAIPQMTTVGLPKLGSTPKLDVHSNFPVAQGGVVFLGAGRLPVGVPTPFGKLLIQPPFPLTLLVAGGTGQLPLPVPNDPKLTGVTLDFQTMIFDVTSGTFGMTNGTEWYLGK